MAAALILVASPVLALSVGDQAPDFTAQTNQGEVSLADYLGKKNVILTFYFAIYTPAWKTTTLAFQEDMAILEGLNTQVMGISRDSMDTVKRFAEEFGITYPLISDGGGVVKKLYSGERINYLIDKTGTIRLIVRGVPDNRLIIDKIKALGLNK